MHLIGTHLKDVHLMDVPFLWASLAGLYLLRQRVSCRGVYFAGYAYQGCISYRVCATHGCVHLMGSYLWAVSFAGIHLKGLHLMGRIFHILDAYI